MTLRVMLLKELLKRVQKQLRQQILFCLYEFVPDEYGEAPGMSFF